VREKVMTRWFLVVAVATGLLVGGCAADGSIKKKNPVADLNAEDDDKEEKSSSEDDLPTKELQDTNSTSPDSEDDEDDAAPTTQPSGPSGGSSTPTPPQTDPPQTGGGTTAKSASCTSTSGKHKSTTRINYGITDDTVAVTKMTVEVINGDQRDKNDVDVFVTAAGTSEKKLFNSGDILANGKITTVTFQSGFSAKVGTKLRVQTNFDTAFFDPSASCTITF
jgi:cytoskeletal protein RodZ